MKILDLTSDIVVKMLFVRNPEALRRMLSAVLGEAIESLTILDPHIPGGVSIGEVNKLIVLDVRVELANGKRVIVEMQMRVTAELTSRLVFYAARDLAAALQRGEDYGTLTPTVLIVWLGERMFPMKFGCLHRIFELREGQTGELLSDQLAVHVLQLDDFKALSSLALPTPSEGTQSTGATRRWARFFLAKTEDELNELASEDESMQSAVDTVKMLSQDPEAVRQAEDHQVAVRMYHHAMALAEQKGKIEGKAEGKAEGERLVVARLLERRFGVLGAGAEEKLARATQVQLEMWADRLLDAATLDDVFVG
jgi:predicted transposase/invertase (TIGR01784 family)